MVASFDGIIWQKMNVWLFIEFQFELYYLQVPALSQNPLNGSQYSLQIARKVKKKFRIMAYWIDIPPKNFSNSKSFLLCEHHCIQITPRGIKLSTFTLVICIHNNDLLDSKLFMWFCFCVPIYRYLRLGFTIPLNLFSIRAFYIFGN